MVRPVIHCLFRPRYYLPKRPKRPQRIPGLLTGVGTPRIVRVDQGDTGKRLAPTPGWLYYHLVLPAGPG
jgi:hypothetical protein